MLDKGHASLHHRDYCSIWEDNKNVRSKILSFTSALKFHPIAAKTITKQQNLKLLLALKQNSSQMYSNVSLENYRCTELYLNQIIFTFHIQTLTLASVWYFMSLGYTFKKE